MDPRSLVEALDARFSSVLDEALRPFRVTTSDVNRLAPKVEELSRAYNAAEAEGRHSKLPLEARIAFSFPRDVPKGAGSVRELVASGALALKADRPLKVLDLGAGLGAMTWGVVRALSAAGQSGHVEALFVDEDAAALRAAEAIADAARVALGKVPVTLDVQTRTANLGLPAHESLPASFGPANVVLLGQVLSELEPRVAPDMRLERHANLVEYILRNLVSEDGVLVIVEPALRDRTRHLHAVRNALLERRVATVLAPCLHQASCPMLALESDWCHEDLSVDLPPWTVPLAKAAGLRWQGLTFSYLVLAKGAVRQDHLGAPRSVRFRAVSELLRSKGKAELVICAEDGTRKRIRQLDRDADRAEDSSFADLRRGDVVTMSSNDAEGPIDERGRVRQGAHLTIDVGAARN